MFNPCHACGRSQIHDVVYINSHQTVFHCVSHELLDRCRCSTLACRAGRLSLLLYSPAQDGKHIKCFPLRAELATNSTRASRPRRPSRRDRKTFSKKLLRGGQTSVYTNSRSARERKQTRTTAWGVSSVWLERRPVTSEVAGSSPVLPANAIKATSSDVAFCV